mmetsp:Transcript_13839/g.22635  ORF Transcript_13839/g.22635 Transcript_13839/m.22635 type:complete len:281 (-) Transcript_13839:425-1267(-)
MAAEARVAAGEIHGAAGARPVVGARIVARGAPWRWHAKGKSRRGSCAFRGRVGVCLTGTALCFSSHTAHCSSDTTAAESLWLLGSLQPLEACAAATVALAALLDDVLDLLHRRRHVPPAHLAHAVVFAYPEEAPCHLLDLANFRTAFADDAPRLPSALHLHHLALCGASYAAAPCEIANSATSAGPSSSCIAATAEVVSACAEKILRHLHEAARQLRLVQVRGGVKRGGRAGHHRQRFAADDGNPRDVDDAEEGGHLGGVGVRRDAANAHPRDLRSAATI